VAAAAQPPVVENHVPQPAADGIVEEIMDQSVMDALNKVTREQLLGPDPDAEAIMGTAYSSSAWIHGPGNVEFLAVADDRLTRIENIEREQKQLPLVNRVDRLIGRIVPGTKLLALIAAPDTDLTATEVKRYDGDSSAWANYSELLASRKLGVDSGYRQLYHVAYVPKTSPLWPALVIDLSKPRERRQSKRKKVDET
jgi:hypothetical protein